MKRLFRGFTLAEVLIVLGIIGVVAALTIPNIATSVQRNQIGPALAKAINTLESANKLILSDNQARSIRGACARFGDNDRANAYRACLNEVVSLGNDGINYAIVYPSEFWDVYEVTIDINSDKGPNANGVDQFLLRVRQNGEVVGANSRRAVETGVDNDRWTEENCGENGTFVACGTAAAGAIIDNGFRVLYRID